MSIKGFVFLANVLIALVEIDIPHMPKGVLVLNGAELLLNQVVMTVVQPIKIPSMILKFHALYLTSSQPNQHRSEEF